MLFRFKLIFSQLKSEGLNLEYTLNSSPYINTYNIKIKRSVWVEITRNEPDTYKPNRITPTNIIIIGCIQTDKK